jgi:hypothetical protein
VIAHRRIRLRAALLAAAAIASVALLAACGDDEPAEDVQALLDRAFSQPIDSADVSVSLDLEFEGGDQLSDPIRLQFSGPYRSNGSDRLPSFDLDGAVQGFGVQFSGVGLISTGRNLYLEVQGIPYALGRQVVTQASSALEDGGDTEAGLTALGIDPSDWIEGGEVEEEGADVAGVPTTHVATAVDVPALIADLNESVELVPELAGGSAPVLSEDQVEVLDDAVADPRLDLFVGDDDDTIRRLALTLGIEIPEEDQAALGGVGSGAASFSIEFANVNEDQRIRAPRNARPLEDLASQVFGLGALFGLPEIPGLTGPGLGGGAAPPGGGGAGSGGGRRGGGDSPRAGAGGITGAFERYGECLLRADPGDRAALERCNDLLR